MRRTLPILLALLLTASNRSFAAEHQDPAGFSFRYPDGWVAVTKLNEGSLEPAVRDWVAKGQVDLSTINVVVVDATQTDFQANCNVLQVKGELAPTEATRQAALKDAAAQFKQVGVEAKNLRADIRQFGMHEVLVLDFDSRMPFLDLSLHQRQAHFAGGGKTYIVTCSALASQFPQRELEFDMILSSFHVPPRTSTGWSHVRSSATTGAIIGGIAGAVAYLFLQLKKKKEPAPAE